MRASLSFPLGNLLWSWRNNRCVITTRRDPQTKICSTYKCKSNCDISSLKIFRISSLSWNNYTSIESPHKKVFERLKKRWWKKKKKKKKNRTSARHIIGRTKYSPHGNAKFAQLMKMSHEIYRLKADVNMRSLSEFVINLSWDVFYGAAPHHLSLWKTWSSTEVQANTPVVAHSNLFSDISAS